MSRQPKTDNRKPTPKTQNLTFGIIGLGRMGLLHATHLNGSIGGALLKAAAVHPTDRERLAREVPFPLVDVDDLIDDPEIDAIAVVSPTSQHREHIERCAEAGVDTFVAGSSVFGAEDPDVAVRQLRDLAAAD